MREYKNGLLQGSEPGWALPQKRQGVRWKNPSGHKKTARRGGKSIGAEALPPEAARERSIYRGKRHYTRMESRRLSAIMAINSLLVGLPLWVCTV